MASDQFGSFKETDDHGYPKLCRLLVDCGCWALRVTFDKIHPPERLYAVLSSHGVQTTLESLFKRNVLNPAQWEKLYPVIPSSVSSANFDVTLLMVLLRSICDLKSPASGWDSFPSSTDKNIEDDIVRLRCFRDVLFDHSNQPSLNSGTFSKYWQDIHATLMRLGLASYGTAIEELKHSSMDPDIEEYYQQLMEKWKGDEDKIKDNLRHMEVEIENLRKELHDEGAFNPASVIDEIRKLYKAHKGWLSPFPWCEEFFFHLDDIYTRLRMPNMKKMKGTQTDEIDIFAIFEPHEGCSHPRTVLIEGSPGIGKTTLCQKICYDWAKEPQDSFQIFELVLSLKCHDINCDLWEAIDDQLLPCNLNTEEREKFFQYIRNNQSKVLLILDGLDELPSNKVSVYSEIIQGRVLPKCYVAATSQDKAARKVKTYCDTLLEIKGFTKEDARNFISKHLLGLRPYRVEYLLHGIRSGHTVNDMVRNPLETALLCLLYEDVLDAFPASRTQLYMETTCSVLRQHSWSKGISTRNKGLSEIYNKELLQLGSIAFNALVEGKICIEEDELPSDISKFRFFSTETSKRKPYLQYRFPHKSFQEFFAAFYLSQELLCGEMNPEKLVTKHFDEVKGVLSFTTGLVGKEDIAICLLKSLTTQINQMDPEKGKEPFKCEDYFSVALDCIGECGHENRYLRTKLATVLGSHLTIQEVALQDGSAGISLLAEVLKANKSLKKLKLCKSWTVDGCWCIASSLAEVLKVNTTLTELNLSGCNVDEHFAMSLARVLMDNSSLTTLDLSDNDIGLSGIVPLSLVLRRNTALTNLNLSGNNFGEPVTVAFSESLKLNATLTSLYLGRNNIGSIGASSLSQVLKVNGSLTKLELCENDIGDAGAVELAEALKVNTSLTMLDLSKNFIGDAGVSSLARALKTNSSLTTLDLNENKFGDVGAMLLSEALKVNTTLTMLGLQSNCIGVAGVHSVADVLRTNTSLKELKV